MQTVQQDGPLTNFKRIIRGFTRMELLFTVVITLVEFGCNMTLDLPGALQNALMSNYKLSASQFSLFYSLYYIPTIVTNAIGGYLIDRVMGIKLSTLMYCVISVIGCALFPIGGVFNMFWMMLLGRIIFGLGNEMATGVCVNYCMFSWYRNSVVNLMSSLYAGFSLLGTLLMYQIGPRLIDYFKQSMPEKNALNLFLILASASFLITAALTIWMTFLKPKEASVVTEPEQTGLIIERKARFRDILQFPAIFWFLCAILLVRSISTAISQFSQGLLTSSLFGLTVIEASNVMTSSVVFHIILAVPISFLVDVTGRNTRYLFTGMILAIVAFIMLIFKANPYVSMAIHGMGNALYSSAVLPMFGYPVENHLIGLCYGIMSAVNGLSSTIAPLVAGKIIDSYGYLTSLYAFLSAATLSLICMIFVYILDRRSTGILSMTPLERIEYERLKENNRLQTSLPSNTSSDLPTISQEKMETVVSDFSSTATLTNNVVY